MSEQTLQLVEVIRARLARTIRRISLADVAFGTIVTVALASLLWALAAAVEALFWLPPTPRAVVLGIVIAASVGVFAYFAGAPLLRMLGVLPPHSQTHVAHRIGARYPEVGDRLRNLLDLSEGRVSSAPPELLDGAVQMLGRQLLPVQFEQVEDFSRTRRAARLSIAPLLILLVFAVAAPGSFFGASSRLGAVGATFVRPAPYALLVEPGDVELIRGSDLETAVRSEGRRSPELVTLAVNYRGEEHVERFELSADSAGTFTYALANVRRPLRYRVESDEVTTSWFDVSVLERPVLRGLQVSLTYPGYTGQGRRALEPNVGDVTALAGTRVDVEVGLGSQQLRLAYLTFDDGSTAPLSREGDVARASFPLRKNGSYRVTLESEQGIQNDEPVVYQLEVIPDGPPSIVLTSPEPTRPLDRELAVPVGARILDDFGFSDLKLHYRLSESRYKATSDSFSVIDLPIQDPRALDQHIAYPWLLAETTRLDPVPGDVVEYYLEVWDNDAWSGFKSAKSELYKLTVPSLAERYRALSEQQDSAEEEIVDLLQETEQIRSQFEQLRNELRQNQEGNWDNQRQLEQIQNRQSEVESRVEQLGEQLQEMTREMESNDLVSEETLEMYDQLRKVVDEINSPELREALQRLQEAIENLDLQQLQQTMGDVEFNEQQYRDRLERTLELFQKLRVQQRLDEAARRAEALAEQQRQLAEQTESLREKDAESSERENANQESEEGAEQEQQSDEARESEQGEQTQSEGAEESERSDQAEQTPSEGPNESRSSERSEQSESPQTEPSAEDLAREQERAKQEVEDLLNSLRETQEQMNEMRNESKQEMQQMMEESGGEQLPGQMQQNAEQLRQQQLQRAQEGQQQMSQQLQQMSQQIRQMQESMSGASISLNIAGIRQALEDVLTLSQNQEAARQGVQQLAPESPMLREYAQEQVRLGEGLSTVADSLQRLSREIPQMSRIVQQYTGEALREMASATTALADRSARTGAAHQQGAMMHLNELALVLADLLDQMMSGGGGSGSMSMQQMLDQLQQAAGAQEQLNQQIQDFLNDVQGNRLSQNAQERLQQMAQQQSQIRQQLREIARNSDARGKLLGDLNRIAEQMEETIQELRAAQADRQTIERQQEILTRLLEAQKSLRERGREERREGRSADDILRESPGALPPSEEAERLRRDLIRALEAGYAPEYQELIKRYFELLQQQSAPAPSPGE